MKWIAYISFILISTSAVGQVVLERELIGSGYTEFAGTNYSLSASVGEPAIETAESTNYIVTQGFQQSNYVLSEPSLLTLESTPAACIGATDGTINVLFISDDIEPPYVYQWSNNTTTDEQTGLVNGVYGVTVTGSNGRSVTNTIEVGVVENIDCRPGFYTGITPNADNFNDYWHVDNYEFFDKREVQIFNRYGSLVWETDLYDNFNNPFVGVHRNGNELPDGTYFYIARFDDSTYKGWIEISR